MSARDIEIRAILAPEEFGFAMTGELKLGEAVQNIATELFRQGGGNHASILILPSGQTLRFALLPQAGATTR